MAKFILLRSVPTSIKNPEGDGFLPLSFHGQITQVMRAPANPQAGADFDEVRRSLRVLDALDGLTDGDTLELEDADYDHLRVRVDAMRFAVVDHAILAFVDAVKNPESVAPLRIMELMKEGAGAASQKE